MKTNYTIASMACFVLAVTILARYGETLVIDHLIGEVARKVLDVFCILVWLFYGMLFALKGRREGP